MTRTSSFTDKMGLDLEQGRVVAVGTNSDLIRESRAYRELLGGYRFYEQANGL
jgi:hypothetical protein